VVRSTAPGARLRSLDYAESAAIKRGTDLRPTTASASRVLADRRATDESGRRHQRLVGYVALRRRLPAPRPISAQAPPARREARERSLRRSASRVVSGSRIRRPIRASLRRSTCALYTNARSLNRSSSSISSSRAIFTKHGVAGGPPQCPTTRSGRPIELPGPHVHPVCQERHAVCRSSRRRGTVNKLGVYYQAAARAGRTHGAASHLRLPTSAPVTIPDHASSASPRSTTRRTLQDWNAVFVSYCAATIPSSTRRDYEGTLFPPNPV